MYEPATSKLFGRSHIFVHTRTHTRMQVVGGRWKPLHYFMARHLYNNQMVTCGADAACFVKNDDAINAFTGSYSLTAVKISDGSSYPITSSPVPVLLPRGGGAITWFCASGASYIPGQACPTYASFLPTFGSCAANGSDCVIVANLTSAAAGGAAVDVHHVLVTTPGNLMLPTAHVTFSVGQPSDPYSPVPVTVTTDATALYVTLTTLAQGRFSDNAFYMTGAGSKTVYFLPFGVLDLGLLQSTTRVEHVGSYV